jgi:hypothetical protein
MQLIKDLGGDFHILKRKCGSTHHGRSDQGLRVIFLKLSHLLRREQLVKIGFYNLRIS